MLFTAVHACENSCPVGSYVHVGSQLVNGYGKQLMLFFGHTDVKLVLPANSLYFEYSSNVPADTWVRVVFAALIEFNLNAMSLLPT